MNEENRILSSADADRLLAAKDGAAALLYLHILRRGGFSLTDAAAARSAASRAAAAGEGDAGIHRRGHRHAGADGPRL